MRRLSAKQQVMPDESASNKIDYKLLGYARGLELFKLFQPLKHLPDSIIVYYIYSVIASYNNSNIE
jgi:hypothetical protein